MTLRSTINEIIERVARSQAGFRWFNEQANRASRREWVDEHWEEDAALLYTLVETLDFDGYDILPKTNK